MSKLIKAFMDMIEGNSKANQKKLSDSEKFQSGEFKKLIQEELSPAKRTRSSKYKHMTNLTDSDTELMNEKEVVPPCVY